MGHDTHGLALLPRYLEEIAAGAMTIEGAAMSVNTAISPELPAEVTMAWQSRPIFVSSTFADMQAERDHLRTHVFPALETPAKPTRPSRMGRPPPRGRCRFLPGRRDARIAGAQGLPWRSSAVPPISDRVAGRSLWLVPPAERIAAAAREVGFDETITGRSVTDLEIQFGILSDAEQQPRSFFYFREPLPYADMPRQVAATYADTYDTDPDAARRSKRLAELKSGVEQNSRSASPIRCGVGPRAPMCDQSGWLGSDSAGGYLVRNPGDDGIT